MLGSGIFLFLLFLTFLLFCCYCFKLFVFIVVVLFYCFYVLSFYFIVFNFDCFMCFYVLSFLYGLICLFYIVFCDIFVFCAGLRYTRYGKTVNIATLMYHTIDPHMISYPTVDGKTPPRHLGARVLRSPGGFLEPGGAVLRTPVALPI